MRNTIISKTAIERYIAKENRSLYINVQSQVTSTNTIVREMAEEGAPEGTVLVAEQQTAGKGRSGRSFYSPSGGGVYFSLLLRPSFNGKDSLLITTAAAVATAKAIEKVTGKEASIKWVNDIFCNGKKVSGILTEGSVDLRTGGLTYAVLGIGINVTDSKEGFPDELQSIAGSLYGKDACGEDVYNRLVGETLSIFMEYYENLTERSFMKEYKARSFVIGKWVEAYSENNGQRVKVLDIDDDAALLVETDSGEHVRMTAGEIRVAIPRR